MSVTSDATKRPPSLLGQFTPCSNIADGGHHREHAFCGLRTSLEFNCDINKRIINDHTVGGPDPLDLFATIRAQFRFTARIGAERKHSHNYRVYIRLLHIGQLNISPASIFLHLIWQDLFDNYNHRQLDRQPQKSSCACDFRWTVSEGRNSPLAISHHTAF